MKMIFCEKESWDIHANILMLQKEFIKPSQHIELWSPI